jgi:hypothetical protein
LQRGFSWHAIDAALPLQSFAEGEEFHRKQGFFPVTSMTGQVENRKPFWGLPFLCLLAPRLPIVPFPMGARSRSATDASQPWPLRHAKLNWTRRNRPMSAILTRWNIGKRYRTRSIPASRTWGDRRVKLRRGRQVSDWTLAARRAGVAARRTRDFRGCFRKEAGLGLPPASLAEENLGHATQKIKTQTQGQRARGLSSTACRVAGWPLPMPAHMKMIVHNRPFVNTT